MECLYLASGSSGWLLSCSYLLSSKERYERSNKHSYCFNELSSMIMVQSKPVCVSGVFVDRAPVRAYLHRLHGPFSAAH